MVLVMTTLKLDTPVLNMADLGPWEPHCGELKVLPPVGLSFKASDHFQGPFFPEGDMAREEMFVPTHFTSEPRRGILYARADTTHTENPPPGPMAIPGPGALPGWAFKLGSMGLGYYQAQAAAFFLSICASVHLYLYRYLYRPIPTSMFDAYIYISTRPL